MAELNLPILEIADEPMTPTEVLGEYHKSNETFDLIHEVYTIGMLDDAAFEGSKAKDYEELTEDYDGILLLGITLHSRENNLLPTRSQLADIARAFNRRFAYTPVVVLYHYADTTEQYLAFANTERTAYKQAWREGEKAGKVTLLKDINLAYPHRGHLAILKKLALPNKGNNAVTSFTQVYYYWQSIFSISILNESFYKEVIKWFDKAVNEVKIPNQIKGSEKHKDFAVRLIARLIFIWFLKELKVVKEELLIPEFANGEENKLIKPKNKGSGYYKFILQNLFFNALNSEIKDRDKGGFDLYSSSFEHEKELKETIFYSPYLNGGLFDIHPNDNCTIDSKGNHTVNNAFVVPDSLFLEKENGLNDILAGYKFTLAENTPLEEEIAVDPEMLGRIFENLLAEQSDDTKAAARSNSGAFYTPRPVVSYMCKSTLSKHLDIEISETNSKEIIQKLLNTTVLDPACGSGAFPMGMLEEMMQILETVDPDGRVWVSEIMKSKDDEFREHVSNMYADGQIRYVKKLGLLRSCLFGVDLLEYAIEITKLRCWLSLIVEQRVDFSKENYNLKPLPNLEFKFYKKNSLFRYYKDQNLNELIDKYDNDKLLNELVNLENEYFIAKSDRHGTKEEIKIKIIQLLEKIVADQSNKVSKELNSLRTGINSLVTAKATTKVLLKERKKETKLATELGELAVFKETIKDYFIERVVFPGIFNKASENPGFDIVIGNPPYVNTKLINGMGLTKKIEEEYGYCDDLYNHFTFRGLELLKQGGVLSYITSDTFLTLQTKKNMRKEFLGIPKTIKVGEGLFEAELTKLPECRLVELINTPKAFAALVDTAIYTLKKEIANAEANVVYIDLRKPDATSFNISEEEWMQVKSSKENVSSWERILDKAFGALGEQEPAWEISHTCDGENIYRDSRSPLLKFKLSLEPYRNAMNYAVFSPTEYNSQILEKIIKPVRPVFDEWWSKIETSRQIAKNQTDISNLNSKLKQGNWSIIGLLTDGGVGLQTGDNGRFVGYNSTTRFANRCRVTRVEKLWKVLEDKPKIKNEFVDLADCDSFDDVKELLDSYTELEIWDLFDGVKDQYGLRIFGKGYMYRIVPETMIFDVNTITDKQKDEGIKGKRFFVPYDKGDREGNRWYAETPYLIEWSENSIAVLSTDTAARWQGYNFFFRNGFCWSDVLNPNSSYVKCRLKGQSVNDVKSMSLYDETGLGDKYLVSFINSYLGFKIIREFLNNTVAIQMNDIRKLPIKIPTGKELQEFNKKFDECMAIKQEYFSGDLDRLGMNIKLKPIELEIDEMVNTLYGIHIKEETEVS
jgi:hypothetical protein